MKCEQYTLILRHDMVIGDDRIKLSPPLVMQYSVDRTFNPGQAILLNEMMDRFKDEVLKKVEQECGT
ncbi:MAG: hypothetical protein ACSW8H_00300 [bacterium]